MNTSMVVEKLLVILVACMLAKTYALSASETPLQIAKNNCEPQCGNVKIPFPFGIGSNCSLDKWFEIFCNKSTTPHRPFLKHTQWEVLDITDFYTNRSSASDDQQFQVKSPISFFNCADKLELTREAGINLTGMPFDFSSRNTFVAVSCGVLAKIDSRSDNIYSQTGCTSTCSSSANSTASNSIFCDGVDCCQTSNIDIYDAFQISFDNSTITAAEQDQDGRENQCKFAFMVDGDYWYRHENSSTTFARIRNSDYVPVNLSWYINYTDMEMFGKNMSASINRFHYCDHGYSYSSTYTQNQLRCYCNGFYGNPYLIGGCSQDINECEVHPSYCKKWGACVNTYGDYYCSNRRKFILVGVGSALGGWLVLSRAWDLYKFIKKTKDNKRKQKFFKRNGGLLLQQQIFSSEGNVQKTRLFNTSELQKATDNFSIDRILGQGGQGTVYKGMLEDGKIVAVKKSKMVDEAQLSQFINEVVILSQINHRNVVQLLGCCLETEVPLLVYEFIPNGTLSQYIHVQNDEFLLTWKVRLQVAAEVAGAISYLHSAASFPIYHRDIKSSNILLDEKYRAKIADFGISRTISLEQTHLTTEVHGTFGYFDPEYFQSSQFTEKSDVFSFGVVLVEILTGQKVISVTRSEEDRSLVTYFNRTMEAGSLFEIVDSQVLEDAPKKEIRAVANLAQRCLNFTGRNRPTMRQVAMELDKIQKPDRASSTVQSNHDEEVEYVRTMGIGPWDAVSTSTASTFKKTDNVDASKLLEISLLPFESH